MTALNNHELLVLERDNRGLGVGDTTGENPPLRRQKYEGIRQKVIPITRIHSI